MATAKCSPWRAGHSPGHVRRGLQLCTRDGPGRRGRPTSPSAPRHRAVPIFLEPMRRSLHLSGWLVIAAAVAYPAAASIGASEAPVATVSGDRRPARAGSDTVSANPGDTVRWDYSAARAPARRDRDRPGRLPRRRPDEAKADPPDDMVLPYSGTYMYSCPLHPGHDGTLTVSGTVTPTPTGTPTLDRDAHGHRDGHRHADRDRDRRRRPRPDRRPDAAAQARRPCSRRRWTRAPPRCAALSRVGKRRAAMLAFRLDEPATVTVAPGARAPGGLVRRAARSPPASRAASA